MLLPALPHVPPPAHRHVPRSAPALAPAPAGHDSSPRPRPPPPGKSAPPIPLSAAGDAEGPPPPPQIPALDLAPAAQSPGLNRRKSWPHAEARGGDRVGKVRFQMEPEDAEDSDGVRGPRGLGRRGLQGCGGRSACQGPRSIATPGGGGGGAVMY